MDEHRKQSVLVIPREVEPPAQFLNCYIFRLGGGLVICSSLGRLLHQVKYQELLQMRVLEEKQSVAHGKYWIRGTQLLNLGGSCGGWWLLWWLQFLSVLSPPSPSVGVWLPRPCWGRPEYEPPFPHWLTAPSASF